MQYSVSIIIPVYNTEKYLKRCLDSIINQTLENIEIICIDDCSQDNSLGVLKDYEKIDARIKMVILNENSGASKARNIGIKRALGEFIGFVDSDDYVDLNFYQKLYEKALQTNADAVKGKIVLKGDCPLEKELFYDINAQVQTNFAYFRHSFTSAIYKRNFLMENKIFFPEEFKIFEDPYFSMKAVLFYKNVAVLNDAFYYYCERENSLNLSTFTERIDDELSAITKIADVINKSNINKKQYGILYDFLLRHVICNIKNAIEHQNAVELFDALEYLYQNCKFKNEQIYFYIAESEYYRNKSQTKKMFLKLRKSVGEKRKNNA